MTKLFIECKAQNDLNRPNQDLAYRKMKVHFFS